MNDGLLKKLSEPSDVPAGGSIKELTDFLDRVWQSGPSPLIMHTGRPGAWMCARNMNAAIWKAAGITPTAEQLEAQEKEIKATYVEEGMYEIGDGIRYIGLYGDHPDGIMGIKREDRYYVERWENGFRAEYSIISRDEFKKMVEETGQTLPDEY